MAKTGNMRTSLNNNAGRSGSHHFLPKANNLAVAGKEIFQVFLNLCLEDQAVAGKQNSGGRITMPNCNWA